MPYLREDQADIRIRIGGNPLGDSWFSAEGGNLTAGIAKTRPGGMGFEVAVGGPATRDDITCTIQMSDIVAGWHKRLESYVGDEPCQVGIQLLGRGRVPLDGASYTHLGILAGAQLPDWSGDSGDVAFYTIVVACNQQAG